MPPGLSVMRLRDFRRLWLAQGASVVGDRLVLVALALYVTDTGSASDLGLVMAAQSLPLVALLLIGGVWADRLPKQRLLFAADLLRGLVQTVVAVLVLAGAAEIWHLVVAGLLFGTAEAFARPAYDGVVPETVPDSAIQEARAVISTTEELARLLGPAMATALVVTIGAGGAFAVDAATFLVSAWLLLGIRTHARDAVAGPAAGPAVAVPGLDATAQAAPSWRTELAEGFREVRSRQWVWVIVLGSTAALLLCTAPLYVLGPTGAEERYGDSDRFGWMFTAYGAGALLGAVTGLRWRPRRPMFAAMACAMLWPLVPVALGAGLACPALLVLALGAGWGVAVFGVLWTTALAERIPPGALSRVSAFDWMGSLALLPVGYALAGPVGNALGTGEVLVGGGLLALAISVAVLLAPGVRGLERVDQRA